MNPRLVRNATIASMIALAVGWLVMHVMAVYTDSFNWDELALLNRAELTRAYGQVYGGGRPGLAVLSLLPFVSSCTETVETVTTVRLVWIAVTVVLLGGFFCFLLRALRDRPWRWHAAILGTASLALVPLFMRWSLQIRTDQPAVAAVIWSGFFALSSRERPRLAIAAGALAGVGYLFSQKAFYVAVLVSVVALGELYCDRAFDWRRELKRATFAIAGLAAVVVAYKLVLMPFYTPPETTSLGDQMSTFANYRKLFGYRLYRNMLSSVAPQLVLLAGIAIACAHGYRRGADHGRRSLIALAVAALGVVIGWFHGSTFPYFWITLGLFPSTAIALGWPGLAALLRRAAVPVLILLSAWLVWIAVSYRLQLLRDTQDIQRRSYAFIETRLPQFRGFNADGGLFCRHDPEPFGEYFREAAEDFGVGPDADKRQDAFIAEFRRRPVAYLLDTFLLEPFPEKIRQFWHQHYVRYAATVSVAGRELTGPAGSQGMFDVIVGGRYKWHGTVPITVGGALVPPGGTIELAIGQVPIVLGDATAPACLCLALPGSPGDKRRAFHSLVQIVEIIGTRNDWY